MDLQGINNQEFKINTLIMPLHNWKPDVVCIQETRGRTMDHPAN